MAIKKEVKVGLIGLIFLFGSLFLFNFLKQKNAFSINMIITAKFDRVDYVKIGQPVYLHGREMGEIAAVNKVGDAFLVELDIDPETKLPKDTRASIVSLSILGGTGIALLYDKPCASNCLKHGDQITGTLDGTQQQVEKMAGPILKKFDTLANTILNDSAGMQAILENAYASLRNLKKTTGSLNNSMASTSKTLPQTIASLKAMTTNLSANFVADAAQQSALDSMLQTISSLTQEDIDAMTKMLYKAAEIAPKINPMVDKAKAPIAKADAQIEKLNKMLKGYEKGSSNKIAKLLHDPNLKDSTQIKIENISIKLGDIRRNPQKYLSLKKEK